MPKIPPVLRILCEPFLSAKAAAEAARGITSGEGALRRINAARLSLDGSVADQMAYLEAENGLERLFSRGLSLITPQDAEAIAANVPMSPAAREVFLSSGRSAYADVAIGLGRRYETANRGATLTQRLRRLKAPQTILHQFSNYVPIPRMLEAAAIKNPKQRAAAVRALADPDILRAGLIDENRSDILTYGFPRHEDLFTHIKRGVSSLSDAQANAFADTYSYAAELFEPAKTARIARWRSDNVGSTLSDDQVAEKIGLGKTLGAYAAHVFDRDARTGHVSYLAELARVSQYGPSSHLGLPAADGDNLFVERLRAIVGASTSTPFRTLDGRALTTTEAAFREVFPSITAEVDVRRHLSMLRSAVSASTDAGTWFALNPAFVDRFLLERTGAQGFVTDFADAMDAYILAASRQIHLDPLTQAGGSWTQFIGQLATVDHGQAVSQASRFRQLTGRTLLDDPAVAEFYQTASRFARRIYRATSLAYPGFAVPNALSLPMLLFPEALRSPGGWRDILNGALLARQPEFKRILSLSGLTATMDQSEVKAAEMATRFWAAAEDGDARAAWVAVSEYTGDFASWINWMEAHVIRPISAAVGASRYLRESGLAGSDLARLAPAQVREMMRTMVEVTEKVTIMPGSANTIPLIQGMRRIPVVGPLSVMFASSPATIAGYMLTNFRQMVRGPNRAGAARVFGAQLFAGTLAAGPFWFFPWLREVQKLPGVTQDDTEALIGALNSWERRFSFAGLIQSDLSRRLNPLTGIAERFLPGQSGIAPSTLGPLGRPVQDAYEALVLGDEPARRRLAGAAAPMLFDLPPSGILPSFMQVSLPAAVGLERMGRLALSTMNDPRGYVTVGPLGLPVKNPGGWRVDALGRPVAPVSPSGEARSYIWGGRDLLDAQHAAEGRRAESKVQSRQSVEARLRRHLIEGDVPAALGIMRDNADLKPVITLSELEREALMRQLPPQARAVYSGSVTDAIPRIRTAAERLARGDLTESERLMERAVLVAGLMKLRNPRQPRDVVLR